MFSLGPAWGAVIAVAVLGVILTLTHVISVRVGG